MSLRKVFKKSRRVAQRGMTLLEIMIVLAILALVMGLVVGPRVMKMFGESKVDIKLSRFTALLEPLMLVLMGGAVAFIVFSILQPIMDLGQLSGPK